MSPWSRHLPAVAFAAAVLAMSGSAGSSVSTGGLVEPWLIALGLSPEAAVRVHHALRGAGHLAAYGLFGWLALRSVRGAGPATPLRAGIAFLLAGTLAVLDEALQARAADRDGEAWDVLLDVTGAAAALALPLLLAVRRRRLREAAAAAEADPAA